MKLGPWAKPEGKHIRRGGKDTEHTSCPKPPALDMLPNCSASGEDRPEPQAAEPQLSKGVAEDRHMLLSGFWFSMAQEVFQTSCPQACLLYLT